MRELLYAAIGWLAMVYQNMASLHRTVVPGYGDAEQLLQFRGGGRGAETVKREAFIDDLVAHMTVPDLGKPMDSLHTE